MTGPESPFMYDGEPVRDHLNRCAPVPVQSPQRDPFFVYVMGPYTAFDASISYTDISSLDSRFIDDPLFDQHTHLGKSNRGSYEAALADLCEQLRAQLGVRAFLATDIRTIPTKQTAGPSEPGMSVLDQSTAFAALSDAVVFVFTNAGLTTGTGSEVGAILGEFQLRRGHPHEPLKPRQRIGIFQHEEFESASIEEIPYTYGIGTREFANRPGLVDDIKGFLENVRREAQAGPLPKFRSY